METDFEYSLTNVLHVFVLSLVTVNHLVSLVSLKCEGDCLLPNGVGKSVRCVC
jgi:hypothetical protein